MAGRSRRSERRQALFAGVLAIACTATGGEARAGEAEIRRNLPARLPDLPAIDEVRPSPIPGLWEVRFGAEIIYSDADGAHVVEGELIDTVARANLTARREHELKAIDVAKLPLRDAVTWRRGKGTRTLVVFADPNCGFCRQFERELSRLDDVTVHTFLIPILGDDSVAKARAIWCSTPAARGRVWRSWMVDGIAPAAARDCDTGALDRNLALQRRHGIVGTPSLVFADGERVAGVLTLAELEKRFARAGAPGGSARGGG